MTKFKIEDKVKLKTAGDNPEMTIESFVIDGNDRPIKDFVWCVWMDLIQNKQREKFNVSTPVLIQD
jgi:hypothetical protein